MNVRGANTGRHGRARRLGAAAVAGLIVLGALPARAGYASLASPELRNWLQDTAAHALKAAEPDNDLHVGGIAALNRSLRSGLDVLDRLAPPRLQRVDLAVRFDHDLQANYRLATVQPIVHVHGGRHVVDLEARFAYDPAGQTSSRFGVGYRRDGADDPLDARLRGGIDQKTDYERYILEGELDWSPLSVSGRLFNDVPLAEAETAEAVQRDPLLDGYDLHAELRVPYVSWLRARARLWWRDNDGDAVTRDQLSLEFRPLRCLRIETGTSGRTDEERHWFTRLRVELEFGGPA